MKRVRLAILLVALALASALPAAQSHDRPDLDAVYKIKDEGFQRSAVMELLGYLTDIHGPRLTNSPNIKAAATWTTTKMTEWGLVNVKREPWGPFGRGWSNEKFYLHATAPQRYPIIGFPKAWTPGTDGLVQRRSRRRRHRIGRRHRNTPREAEGKNRDDGAGRWHARTVDRAPVDAVRRSRARAAVARACAVPRPRSWRSTARWNNPDSRRLNRLRAEFFAREGVLATLEPSRGVNGGTIFVLGPPGTGRAGGANPMGPRDPKAPTSFPQLVIAAEHYNRMFRTLEKKIPVTLEMDVDNRFYDDDLNSFNIVGEIRGTDLAHEVVMVGAHFDSWHSATGATDNAAGSAVMLEAMRILKATGVKMRRTVRIALWTGEEQGLLGSRAYVRIILQTGNR